MYIRVHIFKTLKLKCQEREKERKKEGKKEEKETRKRDYRHKVKTIPKVKSNNFRWLEFGCRKVLVRGESEISPA